MCDRSCSQKEGHILKKWQCFKTTLNLEIYQQQNSFQLTTSKMEFTVFSSFWLLSLLHTLISRKT